MGIGSLWRGSVLLLFSLLVSLAVLGARQDDCPVTKCSSDGPEIRFPFRLKSEPKHCGYPGFELSCKDGYTVLDLPTSSGPIFVRYISYLEGVILIFNPNNCVAALLFDLNFSMSPLPQGNCTLNNYTNSSPSLFHYPGPFDLPDANFGSVFTLFDCSLENDAKEGYHRVPSPCMSSYGHYYVIVGSFGLNGLGPSCTSVKTVCVPFEYQPSLFYGDGSGITLGWELPECRDCENLREACGFVNETTGELGCYSDPRQGKGALMVDYTITAVGACQEDCPVTKCGSHGPEIRFPFRLKSEQHQPKHCSYPGFELSCEDGHTVLDLPTSSGPIFVQSISYPSQELHIFNPNNCDAALFFDLNLSMSRPLSGYCTLPFNTYTDSFLSSYYDDVWPLPYHEFVFTFFDCSLENDAKEGYYRVPSPCMSSYGHHYVIVGYAGLNGLGPSCTPVKTVCVPFEYEHNFFQGDDSGITVRWDLPECLDCEYLGKACGFVNETTRELGCYSKPRHGKGALMKHTITGVGIGLFVLLLVLTSIGIKVYRSTELNRKKEIENQLEVERFLQDYNSLKPTRYSYSDVKRMTQQFKSRLGEGGYGSVFKGSLPNGTLVAVKNLKSFGSDGVEFINEVGTIGRIHHVNVVRLLGFCSEGFKRALIYEFMPNESLEKFIFSKNADINPALGWEKLQDIAIGIARGIEYLHQGCEQRILHFDIKPHNILLDENFNPKISDFGLAKLCMKGQSIVSVTAARGTMGYIAPEVFSRNFGNVSYKSDVYSFGMLLLEMVGGRKNNDTTVENSSQVYFPEWIYNRLEKGEELGVEMAVKGDPKIAKKLTIVAIWCIQWNPVDRPTMTTVVQMLEGNMESLTMPPNPFNSTSAPHVTTCCLEKQYDTKLTAISEISEIE